MRKEQQVDLMGPQVVAEEGRQADDLAASRWKERMAEAGEQEALTARGFQLANALVLRERKVQPPPALSHGQLGPLRLGACSSSRQSNRCRKTAWRETRPRAREAPPAGASSVADWPTVSSRMSGRRPWRWSRWPSGLCQHEGTQRAKRRSAYPSRPYDCRLRLWRPGHG